MKRPLLFIGLLAYSLIGLSEQPSSSEPLGSLLPQTGARETILQEIEVLDTSDLKPEVQRLPQLVERLKTEDLMADNPYVMLPHRPNYVFPVSWQHRPNDAPADLMHQKISDDPTATHGEYQRFETVFQISVKYQIASGLLGKYSRLDAAYTNRSFWQSYNSDLSRPFRETNHEPELILSWATQNKYIDYFSLGVNHHSNGQSGHLSRSWNRIIFATGAVFPVGVLQGKYWYRVPEKSKKDPNSPRGDDNPDITHYLGHGELTFVYAMGRNNLSVLVRNNLKTSDNKGALELNWSFPINQRVKGLVQYFDGYGDSLIDYNHRQQRLSVGIQLSDWL